MAHSAHHRKGHTLTKYIDEQRRQIVERYLQNLWLVPITEISMRSLRKSEAAESAGRGRVSQTNLAQGSAVALATPRFMAPSPCMAQHSVLEGEKW